ncbi:Protein CBG14988 [Caenorhabditis briggsae]|uniref:Major sperm protein n=2 Tax=Caenorhabditis briggsae TaxID=6238 RepID=A8XL58_CAEBR|nr:Protein CBG14988 [Caenorhabditis briggsae]ULU10160.1 hypothetical protein L3Y34_014463 [Caenorhabditis briggsae]CAP33383.1 Protein CBG14988 [Caenorhabditis briggsae]
MMLESIGKRSTRYEFDHAGGDNHLSQGTYSINERDHLNVEMAEKREADQKEHRYFGGLIGNKEVFIASGVALCMYLVNGEYAQAICTALTSVPPAVFSYRVLINQQTTKQGYHTILFYWTIYGLIALIDQFVGTAQGYNLCKAGLLSVIFFHAIRSNAESIPPSWKFLDQASVDVLTTLLTRYDSNGFLANNNSECNPRTPTMTQFSDDSLQYLFPESQISETNKVEISTACSFVPSLEMQSTQRASAESGYIQKSNSTSLKTMMMEEYESSNGNHTSINNEINFKSMSAMTMTSGETSDVVTFPADRITFSANSREATIQVTNVSPSHLMFALKTNADTYLIAAPTSGVLYSGQSMTIRVGVTEQYFEEYTHPGGSIDKLAFDYTVISGSDSSKYSNFSPNFFQSHSKRRLAIRVYYQ